MTLKDEDLKLIYRSYVSKRHQRERQNCPSVNELLRFFESRTRRRKKLKIIDHITNCSACAEDFEFLRELHQYQSLIAQNAGKVGAAGQSRSINSDHSHSTCSIWMYAPVAVGALLLIVTLAVILKWDRPGEIRAAASTVTLRRPGRGQLVPLPLVFEWKTVEGADFYTLEIFDETLLLVWKSPEVAVSILRPPDDIRIKFKPNSPYFWMITAFRNGNKLVESELRRFTLIKKAP